MDSPDGKGICLGNGQCCSHSECYASEDCNPGATCPENFCRFEGMPAICIAKVLCCTSNFKRFWRSYMTKYHTQPTSP
ncbi:unnamed protein product [Strongylus vulgaris]|uniref:Uncharacterized protein n=1 Tax=Strongylus vulgaris TaxID=40348 RepID=A0A3P7IT52_STRVU|nr:unnamed protein product [Strongylus vulgaris]